MDLSQITLTQMRYALAVSEHQNFRAAAASIPVSQSGLSMQVQKLEDLLGLTLFDRTRKPVLLTEEGQRAIEQMRAVLRETERLGQVAAEGDEPAGPYRLGVIPTMSQTVLPLVLPGFVEAYPQVELIVEELKTEEIISRLAQDSLDAGIAATPLTGTGLQQEPLALEAMLAYLPPGDSLLKKKRVTQTQLAERELWVMPEGHCFGTQVLSYCGQARGRAPLRFESGSFHTLIRLVDEGMGVTVLPELVAKELPSERQAQLRPLSAPSPVREIGFVTAREDLRRRVAEVLKPSVARALRQALKTRRGTVLLPQQ